MRIVICLCAIVAFGVGVAFADQYTNRRPDAEAPSAADRNDDKFAVGAEVETPNGVQVIVAQLPDGDFRLANGVIISPEGIIRGGAGKGEVVRPVSDGSRANASVNINTPITINSPPAVASTVPGVAVPGVVVPGVAAPAGQIPAVSTAPAGSIPDRAAPQTAPRAGNWRDLPRKSSPAAVGDIPILVKPGTGPTPEEELTIARLLPRTPVVPETGQSAANRLRIPKNTKSANFLSGKWICEGGLASSSGDPLREILEFDANGVGKTTVLLKDDQCVGAAAAAVKDGVVTIRSQRQICGNGGAFNPDTIICKPSPNSSVANCTYVSHDNRSFPITIRKFE